MNRFISILFSGIILVQSFNISFEDVSKLNVLLKHMEYHQITFGDNYIDFLVKHYSEDINQHDNNHEEHKNLPFKDGHQTSTHVDTSYTCDAGYFSIEYDTFIDFPFNFFYKESTSNFEKPSIFQPPKLA